MGDREKAFCELGGDAYDGFKLTLCNGKVLCDQKAEECSSELNEAADAYALSKVKAALEMATNLHHNVNPACDHESGKSGAGAMRAVIEYRDEIRLLSSKLSGGEVKLGVEEGRP